MWVQSLGQADSLEDSCLENPMDRGAWWATDHGDKKESVMSEHSHLPCQIVLTLSYRSFQIETTCNP